MVYRRMKDTDVPIAVALYIEYYNTYEEGEWTEVTTTRRLRQVLQSLDSFCMMAFHESEPIGFLMGRMEQYADLMAYDLIEIVLKKEWQDRGIGTDFLKELERQLKSLGCALIQLNAVNDEMHDHFYTKLGYHKTRSLLPMSKFI